MYYIEFFFRYFHVLAGIVWIGMLYYFNFVQTEYFKEAEAGAKSDAMAKLAPDFAPASASLKYSV